MNRCRSRRVRFLPTPSGSPPVLSQPTRRAPPWKFGCHHSLRCNASLGHATPGAPRRTWWRPPRGLGCRW
ncbi:Uncharacterised protein [Mycobacteroides abscessus subsp. abscessus]|nr:Uncharacterised protein [Mycobacteroides abscessus subsp. abscessus]